MHYYLSLGSNLGNRELLLNQAVSLIEERIGPVTARSSFFYSDPWGFESEHQFCNICIALDSEENPLSVLHLTQQIERDLGRRRKTSGDYQDRLIDIDLLQVFSNNGDEISISSAELTIPHPLMHLRNFVTIPLQEIRRK